MKKLLKGGVVVSSYGQRQLDVLIENEKIIDLDHDLPEKDTQVIDASGKYVLPGFIDAHTHFELNTGATDTSDNYTTASIAAICRGTTTIIDMATPDKGQSLADCLKIWNKMSEGNTSCDYNYHMSIVDVNDETLGEIPEMIAQGITSFKMYLAYDAMRVTDAALFLAMKAIKKVNGMLGVHCENGDLVNEMQKQYIKEGKTTPYYHPLSRPNQIEAESVNRYLTIAKEVGLAVNIVHLSTKESLDVVKRARKNGQKVYVETCPQYLLLDNHLYDLPGFESAKYVCAPPLRSLEDQANLWDGVMNGDVNTISTDHCDFNYQIQKELGKDDFTLIPGGLPGVETRPELIYTYGVTTGKISIERYVALLSENIAKQFHLYPQKGVIEIGSDADIVIWNPNTETVISAETQLQNCDYSAYEGFITKGEAEKVFLRGQLISEKGQLIQGQTGKFIFRHIPNKK